MYVARRQMGRILAREAPIDADLVVGASRFWFAFCYGLRFGERHPYCNGIVKNRYDGRTFVFSLPMRCASLGIRLKLNPLPSVISGQRLVLLYGLIVRGNTSEEAG